MPYRERPRSRCGSAHRIQGASAHCGEAPAANISLPGETALATGSIAGIGPAIAANLASATVDAS